MRLTAALGAFAVMWLSTTTTAAAAQPQAAIIQKIVLTAMKQRHLKALIVQVRSAGSNVYTAAFGESMSGVPATPNMHFRNGAMAFAYMSTMLLELVDQKKVSLDTKLARFRPDLPNAKSITLRNLVSMTSGYADYVYQAQVLKGAVLQPFRQWKPEELIHIGVSKPMYFKPGTNWGYSHTNFAILGGVLQQITGMPLNQAMHKYVFGPMGLTQTNGITTPYIPEPVLHTFSSERRQLLGVKPSVPFYEESTYWNPSWTTFDGAVQITDVTDMSKSMEAISTGKVLSHASLKAQIGPNLIGFGHPAKGCPPCRKNTTAFHYGLGVDLFGPWIAQNKFFSGSSATVGYLPAKKLTITIEVTYLPQAFDRQGDYKDASVTTFQSLANVLAPNTLPKLP
jgi:CubicO group peptidase (beta-lactamase class C family)